MDSTFIQTLLLTFKLAFLTTAILLVIGLPIARWLAYSRFRFKPVVEALVSMPMVLPPSVIGYYMLVLYSPRGAVGGFLDRVFNL
ncbi:MAG TPA: hypothetical protein PLF35_12630, partial [Prolixibacteraceae bacterium]|nr:hypothetical protein [Prolixibacteraceae bacterium]